MCLIIHRSANTIIQYDLIKNACSRNKDGFGISVIDRGKISTQRIFDPKGNDPEKVYELLEDALEQDILLHLRYATVGEESQINCHPFTVLEKAKDGVDLVFAHNGTLTGFGNGKNCTKSDSREFNDTIATPLLKAAYKAYGDEWATQPWLLDILKKYSYSTSVFTFLDENGKLLIVNRSNGKEFTGWWASNQYSLDPPVTYTNTSSSTSYTSYNPVKPLTDIKKKELQALLKQEGEAMVLEPEVRETFKEVTGVDSLDEVLNLTPEDLYKLCKDYPEAAALLIMDLSYLLFMNGGEDGQD